MLAAGFQNLADLKAAILPDDGTSVTEWDARLTTLGMAVAGAFGRYCNRDFDHATGTSETFSARTSAWVLRRYPVESVTGFDLVDRDGTESSQRISDLLINFDGGLIEWPQSRGAADQRVKITYSGGYWLDDGSSKPPWVDALPSDVLQAYHMQIQHVAESAGLFGDMAIRANDEKALLAAADLTPYVRQVLNPYRRFGMP